MFISTVNFFDASDEAVTRHIQMRMFFYILDLEMYQHRRNSLGWYEDL